MTYETMVSRNPRFHPEKTKTRRPPSCGKSRSVESEENQRQVFLSFHRPWNPAQPAGFHFSHSPDCCCYFYEPNRCT